MYNAKVYWKDEDDGRHLLGKCSTLAKEKSEARAEALDKLWENHLEAPADVELEKMSPGELDELAQGNPTVALRCPSCSRATNIHEARASEVTREERLCMACSRRKRMKDIIAETDPPVASDWEDSALGSVREDLREAISQGGGDAEYVKHVARMIADYAASIHSNLDNEPSL